MALSKNARNSTVCLLTLALCGVPVLVYLAPSAYDEARIGAALRWTARLAFFVYLVVFVARPLRQLVPNAFTASLLRIRPYVGLAFASVMTVHLAIIAWRYAFVLGELPGIPELFAGGIAYTLLFLMAITTFPAPARALGWRNWGRLHKTGLYWVGAVFAGSLTSDVLAMPTDPVYLTIGLLFVFAITVRLSAFVKRRYYNTAAIAADK